MTKLNPAHPTEDALERFLLQRAEEHELETLETHILACDACIARLEALELQISDLKAALAISEEERLVKETQPAAPRKNWFSLPNLSWAGAAFAAVALMLTLGPSLMRSPGNPGKTAGELATIDFSRCASSDVNLSACRGIDNALLPVGRPLALRLATTDIPAGLVNVQVVNGSGSAVWQGQTQVANERAEVRLPQINQPGAYFLRFYAPSAGAEHELLREFRFAVK